MTTTMPKGFTITFRWVSPVPAARDSAVKPPEGKDIILFTAFTEQAGTTHYPDCPKILETSPKPLANLLGWQAATKSDAGPEIDS